MTTKDPREIVKARTSAQLAPSNYVFPGTTAPIGVRLLGERTIDDAKIEAARYCAKRKVDLDVDPDFFDRETQRQIVWKAIVQREGCDDEGVPLPFFESDEAVRQIDSVTLESLWRLYLEHQETKGTLRQLSPADVAELAKRVRTMPQSTVEQLSQFDHATLVRIVVSILAHPPEDEPAAP